MAERGGRSGKEGARYEDKCIIDEFLNVLEGYNYSVIVEPTGEDEVVTDMLVVRNDETRIHIQCKSSNGSKSEWSISDLIGSKLIEKWGGHLKKDITRRVQLESPYPSEIEELIFRAKNSGNNVCDFYYYQLNENNRKVYMKFCKALGISVIENDVINEAEIKRSIDYLSRIIISPRHMSELDHSIKRGIRSLFSTNAEFAFDVLLSWIVDGDILGQEITSIKIQEYLRKRGVCLRLMEGSDPESLLEINREYSCRYHCINNNLLYRNEFEECKKLLLEEKSFIITGNAGVGKSGCTEAIISHCKEMKIPYLAVKLDSSTPHDSAFEWGRSLGFSSSIPVALHKLAYNSNAVIIMDQLDALRWTQTNSYRSIEVCMEVIERVKRLNQERQKKILIVFVCRKYDLVNDNNIRLIFDSTENREEWSTVEIGELDEKDVIHIVGENSYAHMSKKLKKLLKNPYNLFIWEKIKNQESKKKDFEIAGQLLECWFNELCGGCKKHGIVEADLRKQISKFTSLLESTGRLFVPKTICGIDLETVEYLVSEGFLTEEGKNVGFVHQSILDYLISMRMFKQFVMDGVPIEKIIGPPRDQTPIKRYQVQMMLQSVWETDIRDYIKISDIILDSNEIRYYFKSLVFEIIAQNNCEDIRLQEYVLNNIIRDKNTDHWVAEVVLGNNSLVIALLERGILAKWFADSSKKGTVIRLLKSVRNVLMPIEVRFMEERSFLYKDDDRLFAYVISTLEPSDEPSVISYAVKLLQYRPELLKIVRFEISKLLPIFEDAVVKIVELWYQNRETYGLGELYDIKDFENLDIENGNIIIDSLLKYVPKVKNINIECYDWQEHDEYINSIERNIMGILDVANKAIIRDNPERFWFYFDEYMGKGYCLYDELIMKALRYMPKQYSDKIISYICSDFDTNIYDRTSGVDDLLYYTKEVISLHVNNCSTDIYKDFEYKLIHYLPKKAVSDYSDRIENNREKEWGWTYRPFWGKIQHELLAIIPDSRISEEARNLISVLDRRFSDYSTKYNNSALITGGVVKSVITNKKIGVKQWLQIITNKKIPDRKVGRWSVVDGAYIHSDLEAFSDSFREAVAEEPSIMIKMVLNHINNILPPFYDDLLAGCAFSNKFKDVQLEDLEKILKHCDFSNNTLRASYISEIIINGSDYNWSFDTLDMLNTIVQCVEDGDDNNTEKLQSLNGRELVDYSINNVKGRAARAIGRLLSIRAELLDIFRESIDYLAFSSEVLYRMSALLALIPCLSIDSKWASERIMFIYASDIRAIAFPKSKDCLVLLYDTYSDRITSILQRGFTSKDERLIRTSASSMSELYFRRECFCDVVTGIGEMNEDQIKNIMGMAITYLKVLDYHEKAKVLILKLVETSYDMGYPLTRIFHENMVQINSDRDFILAVLKTHNGRKMLHAFLKYMEICSEPIISFADIILEIGDDILSKSDDYINNQWGMADELSKIIIALYDECSGVETDQNIAYTEHCMDIWDVMFERQLGFTQSLSRQLLDR